MHDLSPETPVRNGLVHGRFQPPHIGHIQYIVEALSRAEHLYIGIATPEFCSPEDAASTGYPCTAELNPFSYDERKEMIEAALAEAGIAHAKYSFVPFPSDYRDLDTIIPKDTVFLMSITSPSDQKKVAHIELLGYTAQTIISLPETQTRHRSGAVRESARDNGNWQEMLPPAIVRYISEHNLQKKLAAKK